MREAPLRKDERLTVLQGDALERLRALPDECVQMCVTSPPYWGLRDYGTGTWNGGDAACDHVKGEMRRGVNLAQSAACTRGGAIKCAAVEDVMYGAECGKCGAVRVDQQIGLEKTPAAFVAKLVAVFEEVRRVLKSDGTCWVNLGDSYNGAGLSGGKSPAIPNTLSFRAASRAGAIDFNGLKAKDLCGMPWRVAFALQAAGWYLRQDIIWSKPNPMPESIQDRCTKSHEYLFLLSKSARYFYDAEAIKEPASGTAHARGDGVNPKARWKTPDGWDTSSGNGGHGEFHREGREKGKVPGVNSRVRVTHDPAHLGRQPKPKQNESFSAAVRGLVESRNKRSVWTVATFACPEAHFATYPPDLIKPCVLAGSRPGDVVLDPFAGSGTSGEVALSLGRRALLIDLNPEYVKLIHQRCDVTPGLAL